MSVEEMKNYLGTQGIKYDDAQKWATQVKKTYPHLGSALKKSQNVRADLELAELIHHTREGRFPLRQQD